MNLILGNSCLDICFALCYVMSKCAHEIAVCKCSRTSFHFSLLHLYNYMLIYASVQFESDPNLCTFNLIIPHLFSVVYSEVACKTWPLLKIWFSPSMGMPAALSIFGL